MSATTGRISWELNSRWPQVACGGEKVFPSWCRVREERRRKKCNAVLTQGKVKEIKSAEASKKNGIADWKLV